MDFFQIGAIEAEIMVENFPSLFAESLISRNFTDGNVSNFKVAEDDLLQSQTFELYREENMTSESRLVDLLNSSKMIDCGTMPDIVRVKVCSFSPSPVLI